MGALISHLRAYRRGDRGSGAAEFAIVLPVFLALTLGAINLSMLLFGATSLHFAAEKTARCIAISSVGGAATNVAGCLALAPTYYKGPAIGATFAQTVAGCGNTVTGTGSFTLITGLVNPTVPLSASGCYPLQ